MIEEQLEIARKQEAQRRVRFSLIMAGAVAGILALSAMISAPFFHAVPDTSANDAGSIDTKADIAAQNDSLREAFKTKLAQFESDNEPVVSSAPFAHWNNDAQHTILSLKENAISLFATGGYGDALAMLEQATTLAQSEQQAMDRAFETALNAAASHFAQDAYDPAHLEIAKALELRPDSPDAQALGASIDALPGVLDLIRAADVAHVENDIEREAQALNDALALDPQRTALKNRLMALEQGLRDRRFASHIQNAMAAIANRDIKGARTNLSGAQALQPSRSEIQILQAQVEQLSNTLKIEALLGAAREAAHNDDWQTAFDAYSEANTREPNNKQIVDGRIEAQTILNLSAKIDAHLASPLRLSSPNVMLDAQGLVVDSVAYAERSPTLRDHAERLKNVIVSYATNVGVLVRSNDETQILVRGVGTVGHTKEKRIELKPGMYTFEGIRPGYKSRLINVEIPPATMDMIVEVICDEQL